jgi:hypothetical protein
MTGNPERLTLNGNSIEYLKPRIVAEIKFKMNGHENTLKGSFIFRLYKKMIMII